MTKLLAPLLAIVLLGAGCSQIVTSEEAKTETKPAVTTTENNRNKESGIKNQEEARELVAAKTDDTWKTYTSKSLGFSFQWPTRGRYAPQWEVIIKDLADGNQTNDCLDPFSDEMIPASDYATLGTTKFCHVQRTNGADNFGVVLDSYGTKIGKKLAVIKFEKALYADKSLPCFKDMGADFSVVKGSCVAFHQDEYLKTLDSIVGTFKLNQ